VTFEQRPEGGESGSCGYLGGEYKQTEGEASASSPWWGSWEPCGGVNIFKGSYVSGAE